MLDRKGYRYALIGLAVAEAVFLIGVSVIVAVGHDVPKEMWTVGTALGGGLLGVLVPRPQATSGAKPFAEAITVHNAASLAALQAAEEVTPPRAVASAPGTAGEGDDAAERVSRSALKAASDVNERANLKEAMAAASPSPGTGAAVYALAGKHGNSATRRTNASDSNASNGITTGKEELAAEAAVYAAAATAAASPETVQAAKEAAQSAPAGGVKVGDYLAKLLPPFVVFGLALWLGTHLTGETVRLSDYRHAGELLTKAKPEAAKAYLEALMTHQQAVTSEGNALIALATAAGGAIVGVLAPSPGEGTSSGTK